MFARPVTPSRQVRIVYFDIADTILDTEVQARLGMQSNFDQPFVGAPRVKRTGVHEGLASSDLFACLRKSTFT